MIACRRTCAHETVCTWQPGAARESSPPERDQAQELNCPPAGRRGTDRWGARVLGAQAMARGANGKRLHWPACAVRSSTQSQSACCPVRPAAQVRPPPQTHSLHNPNRRAQAASPAQSCRAAWFQRTQPRMGEAAEPCSPQSAAGAAAHWQTLPHASRQPDTRHTFTERATARLTLDARSRRYRKMTIKYIFQLAPVRWLGFTIGSKTVRNSTVLRRHYYSGDTVHCPAANALGGRLHDDKANKYEFSRTQCEIWPARSTPAVQGTRLRPRTFFTSGRLAKISHTAS